MKRLCIGLVCCLQFLMLSGQSLPVGSGTIRWIDPQTAGFPVVQGQAWSREMTGNYCRLPENMRSEVRPMVWTLACHSAGLSIWFRSNAAPIRVRYAVTHNDERAMPHMPATGVSGLDLYAVDQNGWERYVPGKFDWTKQDTVYAVFQPEPDRHFARQGYEFRLYLPLYNGVSKLEIGVDSAAQFRFLPVRAEKPIVAYGTSIMQGACASRPGMAWSTILSRKLDYPLLNFGFSGNGTMDSVVLDELGKIDARMYIVDCLPNLVGIADSSVTARFRQGVALLRKYHRTPILLVEHAEAEADGEDSAACHKNALLRACYEQLREEGVPELYYLSCREIGLPDDALVDGIHPSDYGMMRQAMACERKIREIFGEEQGNLSTTRPVRQRRDAPYYEWSDRHEAILTKNRIEAPKNVLLGNSIVHFWGGADKGRYRNGAKSWEQIMSVAGFSNMGCGFDRIENLLWRVCHGELDGYEAERVVVMIGTNNLSCNTDDEIIRGIAHLVAVIARHQPSAGVEVIGLLPRRGMEDRVSGVNTKLEEKIRSMNLTFRNPGTLLLGKGGKIDESLFRDGLHPNEKGYGRIAPIIAGME